MAAAVRFIGSVPRMKAARSRQARLRAGGHLWTKLLCLLLHLISGSRAGGPKCLPSSKRGRAAWCERRRPASIRKTIGLRKRLALCLVSSRLILKAPSTW